MSLPAGFEAPGLLPSFKRILLATDFSRYSAAAVPFATLFADYYDATVFATHVIPAETEPEIESEPGEQGEQARESAETRMQRFLAENPLGEAPVETIITRGRVWDVLADVVEKEGIDLIVLGTHGRRGLSKLMMGSVAEHIFQMAPCPVLSVGGRARKTWGTEGKLSRILYATDLSTTSLNTLPYALSLAKVSDAELALLHVPESSPGGVTRAEESASLHARLNSLIPAHARAWCRCDTFVISGDPAEVILRVAKEHNVDIVVIGGHRVEGRLYTVRVPITTAYRVVSRADWPVLRVRS
ncbi:MAG: universal stress protein [Terriglobales bacterium]